jgi:hypothetical protein
MTTTCKFCNTSIGDETETLGSILKEPGYEPEFFGDEDFAPCDECGRVVCMECAFFDFPESGPVRMRYLCPDCGQPEHVIMEQRGAPKLPMEVEG